MGENEALITWSSTVLPVLKFRSCDKLCPNRWLEEKVTVRK